jgi:hypothetical protein
MHGGDGYWIKDIHLPVEFNSKSMRNFYSISTNFLNSNLIVTEIRSPRNLNSHPSVKNPSLQSKIIELTA